MKSLESHGKTGAKPALNQLLPFDPQRIHRDVRAVFRMGMPVVLRARSLQLLEVGST